MSFDAFASSVGAVSSAPPLPSTDVTAPSAPQTPNSAPPETSAAPKGPAPAADGAIKGTKPNSVQIDPAGAATVGENTPEMPAFAPEFKFKVMDKEHEIPEMFRALVKDADSQKAVKEIFEKAYGLDVVKPRMKEFQEKFHAATKELEPIKNGIQDLRNFVAKDDYDSFLKYLNIPEEKVLQWAVNKAKYMELPQDQRQVLDAKRAAEERLYSLEKENSTYQQQLVEQKNAAKISDLRTELSKPDITAFAKSYDQRRGQEGAFIDAVIEVGKAAYFGSQGKVDLTAVEAIQRVVALAGGIQTQAPSAAPVIPAQGAAPVAQAPQAEPQVKKNTLPNLASKHTTAVSKPKFTSLAELKKHAAKMGA